MQKYPKGMQKLGRGIQCIKMGKRRHNRIHTLIQSRLYKNSKNAQIMGIFFLFIEFLKLIINGF